MKATYRAMQVGLDGRLELVERPMPALRAGEVLIQVESCGVCGADARDIEKADPSLPVPRVPGHEVVGRLVALGLGVSGGWTLGQRVGVGRLGGHCQVCISCRQGRFQLCSNQPVVGASVDGGYAEMMLARSTGLVAVPEELSPEEASPLLCAGLATFKALRKSGAQAGDVVAVQGVGGLGHLALQYARKMGFKVIAIGRGTDIADDAVRLGAHRYIDAQAEDAAARLSQLGGAQVILTTITDSASVSELLPALAPRGTLLVLGVGREPLSVLPGLLVGGERTVQGSITGTPFDAEKTLDFSVLAHVRPRIQCFALEQANEAVQWMRSGNAKFRAVLKMENV